MSDDILLSYLYERGIMLLRGLLIFRKPCFVGKNVEIKCKKRIKIGKFVTIHSNSYVDGCSKKGVVLEDNTTIGRDSYVRTGNFMSGDGYFIMRKNSSFNYNCFIGATGGIEIGENVIIGPNVSIISEQHNYEDLNSSIKEQGVKVLPVTIEDDVWIGTNVTILGGVIIKKGSILGAYSLVNKSTEENGIYVGIPAKKLKSR